MWHKSFTNSLLLYIALLPVGFTAIPSNGYAQILNRFKKTTVSGDVRAEWQYDRITGMPQNRPKNIRTLSFAPQFNIPGLPKFGFVFKLSSLESYLRQPFNRFALQLLPRWGGLYLGDAYPVLSKYTLNGILIRGVSVDVQWGLLRLAAAAGQSKRSIEATESWYQASFQQYLYAFKIGLGKKDSTRIYLNFLKAKDDSTSIVQSGYKTPKENVVVSLDGYIPLHRFKSTLGGEIAAAAFNRDTQSRELQLPKHWPSLTRRIFKPRASSQYDYALYLEARTTQFKGKLTASFQQIGPGFYSLGTAYLHNDIRKYATTLSRRFWRNRLYLYGGYDRSRDNLAGMKTSTAVASSKYVNGSLVIKSLPSLNAGYRNYVLKNNDAHSLLNIANVLHSSQMTLSHRLTVFNLAHMISVSGASSWYRMRGSIASTARNYDNLSLRISESTTLKIPLTLFASIGILKTKYKMTGQKDTRWLYNLGLTYRALNNHLYSNLAVNYDEGKANEYYRSTYQDTTFRTMLFSVRKRTSLSFRSDYQTDKQTLSIRIERIIYRCSTFPENNYREFIVRFIYTRHLGKNVQL